MNTNTNPAAVIFAATREPSPLSFMDHAPRISFGFGLVVGAYVVAMVVYLGARALRKKHEADEAERAALEARRRAALAAMEPGTLAQMDALCEAERAIARSRKFAKDFAK